MTEVQPAEDRLRWASTYFVRGDYPTKVRLIHPYRVTDPPTAGQALIFIIPGEKRSTLFDPFTLWSAQVDNRAAEVFKAKDRELRQDFVVDAIKRRWELVCRLGGAASAAADLDIAALVLNRLGASVPTYARASSVDTDGSQKERGGKEMDETKRRFVDPASRRGGVLKFFIDGTRSLLEAMAELGLTRSGVLSHLFALNRDHGIGYHLAADCATVVVPEGWDPFAAPAPAVARPAPTDGSAPQIQREPRQPRGSKGKATDPARLAPIPEGSKRAAVALHFARGPSTLAECEAATGIGARSIHSHLHDIHSYHGLGHAVDGDRYHLDVPEGFTVTGPRTERKRKPA